MGICATGIGYRSFSSHCLRMITAMAKVPLNSRTMNPSQKKAGFAHKAARAGAVMLIQRFGSALPHAVP